jgi:uncharacterized integral membrane protein
MNSKRKPPRKPPVGTPRPVDHQALKPPIERVPGLGRTWYKRGVAYWTLRAVFVLMALFILIVGCFMTGGLGYGLWQSGLPLIVRILLFLIIVAAIVRSSIKAWSAFILVGRSNRGTHPMTLAEAAGDRSSPRERRRAGTAGAARGTAAAMGSAVSGALLVISVVANFGWFVVFLICTFQRYYLGEYAARARLQQWCDQHAVPSPLRA